MSDPYIGEIKMVGFNFAPYQWAFCDGQLLAISQNTALFSILGTTYGGNGISTFALPDLRSRTPIHWGQGPGLTPVTLGETFGQERVTLLSSEIPAHTHALSATTAAASQASPTNGVWAVSGSRRTTVNLYKSTADGTTMAPQALALAGGSQSHNNMSPYLAVTFIIALAGVFPSRA